jgi:hypothetical protein
MHSLFGNIRTFYMRDCCWPYAVSFWLVLIIFWQDFSNANRHVHGASLVAYGIILGYYLYILHLYFRKKLVKENMGFFLAFLSAKILILGILLIFCYQ